MGAQLGELWRVTTLSCSDEEGRMSQVFPVGFADFRDGQQVGNPWVSGAAPTEDIAVVDPRPEWQERFAKAAADIREILGDRVQELHHIGSTAVAGLPAKDVVDIDLIVVDASDEASYLPELEALGYVHTVREPEFEEHRMLRGLDPRVNLHVYGVGAVEPARHLLFRDWLREHTTDRELYAERKREAAGEATNSVVTYNERKQAVTREIYARAFAGVGVPIADRALAPKQLPALPAEVRGARIHWRALTADDVDLVQQLVVASGRVDHPTEVYSRASIALGFKGDRFTLATDTIVGLNNAGEAIAYGEAHLGDTAETETAISLDGTVHPDWRGEGVGRALIAWQEARARQLLAETGSDLPAMLDLGAREENLGHLALYRAAGFQPVRWWMELWRPLAEEIPSKQLAEGVTIRPLTSELSEATRIAINDAFRDHWGSQPTTQEEWNDWHALDEFAASLSRIAVIGDGTAERPFEVVGAVLSMMDEAEWEKNGGPFAYMATIGVVRAWRGRGLSSALITETLRAYKDADLQHAALDVDAANPSGALQMYTKFGFAPRDRSITYAKRA